jgi:UDP-N-acetylmuramate dehydrogenase
LLVSDLRHALRGFQGAVREAVPLASMTHIRIGGPAAFFVEPKTEADVGMVVRAARELDQPIHMLGGGSNVLVSDDGVPGLTMSLGHLNRVMRDELRITAGAGVTLPSLIRGTKDLGLAGLELLIGIPAVVGGAVAMNAGTRDTDTFERLVSVTVVDEAGELRVLSREQTQPSYRNGGFGQRIVVQATFDLEPDDGAAIFARMEASLKRRKAIAA